MSNATNTLDATTVGGWTKPRDLTAEDKAVFNQAMEGFVGVHYTPNKVSTQLVAGMNYRYQCTAELPQGGATWPAIVEIFKPLDGKPYITNITRVLL